jgi:hypothetical protein
MTGAFLEHYRLERKGAAWWGGQEGGATFPWCALFPVGRGTAGEVRNPKSEGRKKAEGRNPNKLAQLLHTSNGLTHWTPRESSVGSAMFIATFRAESQAPSGAACRPTTRSPEPPMPLLTELGTHLLVSLGYKHDAPNGAVPPTQECEMCRPEAAPGARFLRGPRLAVRRVQDQSAPIAASRAGYFGLRVSAFFRISGFGLRVWETDSRDVREQPVPTYVVFRRTVSRCAQSGLGSG